jgi:hypothetical protein
MWDCPYFYHRILHLRPKRTECLSKFIHHSLKTKYQKMKHFYLLTALCLALTGYANAQTNLLTNPGAESNYDGWTATCSGYGRNWGIDTGSPLSGTNCWVATSDECTLTQTVDFIEKGYTEARLDAQPMISFGVYIKGNGVQGGTYSIKAELLDASGNILKTQPIATSSPLPSGTPWYLRYQYFSNYGTGVRKIRLTFSGYCNINWSDHYGPSFDDAFVMIENNPLSAKASEVSDITAVSANIAGIVANPSENATDINIEYGTTESLGSTIVATQKLASDKLNYISASLAGLIPGTKYYYRVAASDGSSTAVSDIKTFATEALQPFNVYPKDKVISIINKETLYIEGNTSWTVSIDQPWLTVSQASGCTYANLEFTATENNNKTERSAHVTITPAFSEPQVYTFNQSGLGEAYPLGRSMKTAPVLDTITSLVMTNNSFAGYFRFIPTQSGNYTFESESNTNPQISLYAESDTINALASNDDADPQHDNYQFSLNQALTAGTVYYIALSNLNSDRETITLKITGGGLQGFEYRGFGNWSETTNWNWGELPGWTNHATVRGNVTVDKDVNIKKLIIRSDALVVANDYKLESEVIVLEADEVNKASLLTNSTGLSGTVQIFEPAGTWVLYSPATTGATIASFLQNANNAIATKESAYGMMDYNTTYNSWNNYFTTENTATLTAGKGYCVRRSGNGGIVSSTGSLISGNYSVSLSNAGEGWNCIGNPYPSALKMTDEADVNNNFLKTNASSLDPKYACLYIWDGASYKIKGNAPCDREWSESVFPSGQGFFVKTASEGASVSFTPEMQTQHSILCKKAAKAVWPNIQLSVASGSATATAVVAFNQQMTNGLDVTYDAGLLRGTSGLNLYSRLVDDNGVDFAIQCLPTNYSGVNIPLGVECKDGGNITFSAETAELPADASFELFDSEANIATPITDKFSYVVNVEANANLVNRFYLRSKSSSNTTSVNNVEYQTISAYANAKHIYINGAKAGSRAQLFDVNGRCVSNFKLNSATETISAEQFIDGVYVLKVYSNNNVSTFKVMLK